MSIGMIVVRVIAPVIDLPFPSIAVKAETMDALGTSLPVRTVGTSLGEGGTKP